MRNMKYLFVLLAVASFSGCGVQEKKEVKQEPEPEAKATTEVHFFPVTSFIEGQVHVVDSFQSVTMKYTKIGEKVDTTLISIADFRQLSREFTDPDFNSALLKPYFRETSFADQSIKAVTFNYTTENNDLEIRRVDVVVDASAITNDKVRSIYMEKQSRREDTMIYKKLYWRADKNFQIITTQQVGNKAGIVSVTKVEWN